MKEKDKIIGFRFINYGEWINRVDDKINYQQNVHIYLNFNINKEKVLSQKTRKNGLKAKDVATSAIIRRIWDSCKQLGVLNYI